MTKSILAVVIVLCLAAVAGLALRRVILPRNESRMQMIQDIEYTDKVQPYSNY